MRNGFRIFLIVFAVSSATAVLACLFLMDMSYERKAAQCMMWKSCKAKVVSVDYERSSRGRRISSMPHVTYIYKAEGAEYTSDRITYQDLGLTADEIFRRFSVGDIIDAYYNPADPSESVIIK